MLIAMRSEKTRKGVMPFRVTSLQQLQGKQRAKGGKSLGG